METSMEVPQKTKNIPTFYQKEFKLIYKRSSCIPMFISALFTMAKLESVEVPNNQRMDKENIYIIYVYHIYIHIHMYIMQYYTIINKISFAGKMDATGDHHVEQYKPSFKKKITFSVICGI
jgi:hypothetical protein